MMDKQDQNTQNQPDTDTKCGFIAVVGRPNVGKSTLTNALAGAKLSIVSRKAQTTRHRIQAILTRDNAQYVFVDTPGFQTRHTNTMNRMMNRVVTNTLSSVDVVLHLVQAGKWTEADQQVVDLLPQNVPTILVITKVDLLKDKNSMFEFVTGLMHKHAYDAVVPISATKNIQLDTLLDEVDKCLPDSEFIYDEDTLSDRSVRFIAAEMIREKIFRLVGDELPYNCTVVIEKWEESETSTAIAACIVVEREGYKPILLGAKGEHMKRIATEARQDIEELLGGRSVYLEVYIKVRKGWADKESLLRELGIE